ncbi:MAG: T9SS type A sorting domain-containing protein [Saprospiraceae bacterium]|nr:T9SS type A sorting domain-containing protein [Saprospiraceae bacterium]
MIKSLFIFATTVISQITVFGQEPFNKDWYVPLPLQSYTPPKDTAFKENKLIVFNILDQKFDTLQTENYMNHPKHKSSPPNNKPLSEMNKNGDIPDFTFSNVQPADQLAGFPNYPNSTVVKMFITFFNPKNNQNSFGTCSGIMIHPGFILTGGHCVKSKFDSSYAVSITVIPAYNLGSRPFGLTTVTNWYSFTQWTQNGNLDYDMAILSLSNPIGNASGWLDWGYHADTSFFTSPANVFYSFGYPGYDPIGNPVFEEGERMYYMTGNMDYWQSKNTMCHYNIGYQGQSGSGLFYTDSTNKSKVFGVLSHGNIFPPYFTCHCRMDSSMFNYFNSIIPTISDIETKSSIKNISIYPNPSNSIFNIDFSEIHYKEIELRVFNALGMQIKKASINQFNSLVTINLESFPTGTYFIKAGIDGKLVNGRICKTD